MRHNLYGHHLSAFENNKNGTLLFPARRPPVEETTSFLNSLLASHGPNYLEKLFGSKARHRLRELGGVDNVAIALSGKHKQQNKRASKSCDIICLRGAIG